MPSTNLQSASAIIGEALAPRTAIFRDFTVGALSEGQPASLNLKQEQGITSFRDFGGEDSVWASVVTLAIATGQAFDPGYVECVPIVLAVEDNPGSANSGYPVECALWHPNVMARIQSTAVLLAGTMLRVLDASTTLFPDTQDGYKRVAVSHEDLINNPNQPRQVWFDGWNGFRGSPSNNS